MKKSKILLLLIVLILIPNIAKAEIEINPSIVADAQTVELSDSELIEFKEPLSIIYKDQKNNTEDITSRFKEGIRNLNDRTAVGVRDFVNIIPYTKIYWNQEHKMVVVRTSAGGEVILPIDKNVIYVNGERKAIDTPATLDHKIDRTFLPLRTLAEVLRYEVDYDIEQHAAILYEPLNFLGGDIEPDVPTAEEIFGPVNEMFTNSNRNSQDVEYEMPEEPETVRRSVDTASGPRDQKYAYIVESKLIDKINDYRKLEGLEPFVQDGYMEEMTAIRASEVQETRSPERPNNLDWQSIGDVYGQLVAIVSLRNNPEDTIFEIWENQSKPGEGILSSDFKRFSVSVVYDGEAYYAIALFGI